MLMPIVDHPRAERGKATSLHAELRKCQTRKLEQNTAGTDNVLGSNRRYCNQ
jgi:hypothetical protein